MQGSGKVVETNKGGWFFGLSVVWFGYCLAFPALSVLS